MVPAPIIGLEHSVLTKYAILDSWSQASSSLQEILFVSTLIYNQKENESSKIKQEKK